MSSKREMNEWAGKAIQALAYCIADLKRFRNRPLESHRTVSEAEGCFFAAMRQKYIASDELMKIFDHFHPGILKKKEEPKEDGGDRHVRIQRARLLEASPMALPAAVNQGQLFLPEVELIEEGGVR